VINAVPALIPVMVPEAEPAVAIAVAELVHVPPVVVDVHVWDDPVQTGVVPLIVCVMGDEIVTIFVPVLTHPPIVTVYVIREVPALTPVTTPLEVPTAATAGVSLVHVPPVVVLVQVCEEPIQIGVVPVIA